MMMLTVVLAMEISTMVVQSKMKTIVMMGDGSSTIDHLMIDDH